MRNSGGNARTRLTRLAAAAALAIAAAAAPVADARAEALDLAAGGEDWRFTVTPYLFLPVRTTGTSTVAGSSVDLDMNLADVLDLLNFAASGRMEAWKGDFGLMADVYYVNISIKGGFTGPGGAVGFSAKSKTRQGWVALLGAYRFADGVTDDGRAWALDASAGVRWNSLKQTIEAGFDIGSAPGPQFELGGTETWWEPVIGLRGAVQINDEWTFGARGELGGFGANGSDLQWLVVAGFDWRAWERTSIKIGWQFYGIDYATTRSDGAFGYDVFQTGPYMGMTFRF